MNAVAQSYRFSHIDKGEDYQADFSRLPSRNLAWKIEQRILESILSRFLKGRSVEHLDFACGTGRILSFLENKVATSTGVDVSASMLDVARSRTVRSRILQADVTREEVLAESKYDLITAFRFFANAEAELRREALRTLARHLKRDGIIVFNNHRSTTFSRSRIARLVTQGRRGNYGMSPTEVSDLVSNEQLAIAATYHLGMVPEIESKPFRPRWLVNLVEEVGTRFPMSAIAGNIIYVCRQSR